MNSGPRSYSTLQLAQALGVSVQTVQRWVDAGHVKAWKTVGGHRKIDADSADAWIRAMGAAGGSAPEASAMSASGTFLRVLLVDDDSEFLDFLATLVADILPGAEIEKAHNGFEALQSMARTTPDLLVTDVVMPQLSGTQLAVMLAKERPDLAVLFVSGYPGDAVIREPALDREVDFLDKPYSPAVLAERVRHALDRRQAAVHRNTRTR